MDLAIAPEYDTPALRAELEDLAAHLPAPGGPLPPFRRNRLVRAELACGPVAVKAFPPQGWLGSRLARRFGSKARRSWDVACALRKAGVGTPAPIACVERWEGAQLAASYFLAEHVDDTSTLHAELIHLYRHEAEYGKLLNLLDVVAAEVRKMHDAGIVHRDLGNQNVFVRRLGPDTWGDVRFIDVNRGRVRPEASWRARGRDLSRLTLPSRLMKNFLHMYTRELYAEGKRPPNALVRWERFYRFLFAAHTATRRFRHPVRMWRRRKARGDRPTYPRTRDLWIWDRHRYETAGAWMKREKLRYTSWWSALRMAGSTVLAFFPVWFGWLRARKRAYAAPVEMRDRIGLSITPTDETAERTRELLAGLGRPPLLLRYYHHAGPDAWAVTTRELKRLHEEGYPVSIALIQDRRAVLDPDAWRAFGTGVLESVGDRIEYAEVGHAVNRVKWGIWSLREHARLLAPLREWKERWPGVKFIGPAVNDFEYHYVLSSLSSLPRGTRFDGLSLHLYMDRSGAPEDRQMVFSGLDKFTLARVLARWARRCADRVVITEVNWPLGEEGGRSHPFAPYVWAGNLARDTTATLQGCADYMIRYYLHALCSGMVDRVYWWKLVGESFGLVNDKDPARWEPRPGYAALATFLRLVGPDTFREKLPAPAPVHVFRFDRVAVAYSAGPETIWTAPFEVERVLDRDGNGVSGAATAIRLTGSPVYLLLASRGSG